MESVLSERACKVGFDLVVRGPLACLRVKEVWRGGCHRIVVGVFGGGAFPVEL
jgi:hypothetical protein